MAHATPRDDIGIYDEVKELRNKCADLDTARCALELRLSCQKGITLKVENQRDALLAALNKYGNHDAGCDVYRHPKTIGIHNIESNCDCGFSAALSATETKKEK